MFWVLGKSRLESKSCHTYPILGISAEKDRSSTTNGCDRGIKIPESLKSDRASKR